MRLSSFCFSVFLLVAVTATTVFSAPSAPKEEVHGSFESVEELFEYARANDIVLLDGSGQIELTSIALLEAHCEIHNLSFDAEQQLVFPKSNSNLKTGWRLEPSDYQKERSLPQGQQDSLNPSFSKRGFSWRMEVGPHTGTEVRIPQERLTSKEGLMLEGLGFRVGGGTPPPGSAIADGRFAHAEMHYYTASYGEVMKYKEAIMLAVKSNKELTGQYQKLFQKIERVIREKFVGDYLETESLIKAFEEYPNDPRARQMLVRLQGMLSKFPVKPMVEISQVTSGGSGNSVYGHVGVTNVHRNIINYGDHSLTVIFEEMPPEGFHQAEMTSLDQTTTVRSIPPIYRIR